MGFELFLFSFTMSCFTVSLYVTGLLWFADKHTFQVKILIMMGVGICYWLLFDSIATISRPGAYGYLYILRSVALVACPWLFFCFVMSLNGFEFIEKPFSSGVIGIILIFDITLLVTNRFHRLVFARDGFPLPEYGPLFPLHSALAYVPVLLGIFFLVRFIVVRKPQLWFIIAFAFIALTGLLVNVFFTLHILSMTQDIAPYTFFAIFVLMAALVYRSRLLNFKTAALRNIFQSYKDAVLIVDLRGIISDCNAAFSSWFYDAVIEPQRTPMEYFLSYFEKKGALWNMTPQGIEITIKDRQGNDRTFTIKRQMVYSGLRLIGNIFTFTDVSSYRIMLKKQEELRILAESASRAKSAFLATMSHEIRTPLNAIIGLSSIQLQNKKLPQETVNDIKKIYNSGSDLLGIINDILDISKIESGGFKLVPVVYDVAQMINTTIQVNMVRIGLKPIKLILSVEESIPRKLRGDELRVKQILNNLLSNAIKYTRIGEVRLEISWKAPDPGGKGAPCDMCCRVSDTGQGIREEDVPRLFAEYSQMNILENRYVEGTGLGLSITRNLVHLMNGSISVESEFGKGSVFSLTVRQEIADPNPLGKETAEALESGNFRSTRAEADMEIVRTKMSYGKALVVDDVELNLDVASGIMEPYGLTVECVQSGKEAVEKVRSIGEGEKGIQKYDLIFMDHMMPGMDGIEAVRRIRNEIDTAYAKEVPIIALTANAMAGNEELFLSNGFTGFISKPIDLESLDAVLNKFIRKGGCSKTHPGFG
ncbi:MAG: response regulator [Treponema sp.]|jgi:signal transduction histidine kinase/AmiR/NasT family two-component response regulator|nr:response regulator [Treponema sp.]